MVNPLDILRKFNDLKTLPHVMLKVNQIVSDPNSSLQDFEEIIIQDPVLTSRLLRSVNSPYYALPKKITSISTAILYVGTKQLRNLVAVETIRDSYADKEGSAFSRSKLWFHSATVSVLADMIAKRIFGLNADDIFMAGVIHDIGLIAEAQVMEPQMHDVCQQMALQSKALVECEREVIGTEHSLLGSLLLEQWNMPADICEAVKLHHKKNGPVEIPGIASILMLADYMATKMNSPPVQNEIASLHPKLAQHLKERLVDYKIIVKDLPSELQKAKELYGIKGS